MSADTPCQGPNILMIVVDCLRADRCPPQGRTPLTCWPTLCRQGAIFTQMISSASTTPVCFAGLLTGQYSFVHGIRTIGGPRLSDGVPLLQTTLKELGYTTYAYVTGPLAPSFGLNADFDVYDQRGQETTVYSSWGQDFLDGFGEKHFSRPAFVLLHLFELHRRMTRRRQRAQRLSKRTYDRAWRELDDTLAEMLQQVPSNTIVVLTADHGECIVRRSDRHWWGHLQRKARMKLHRPRHCDDYDKHGFHVYDELVRIPCAFVGPGVPAGVVNHDPVRQIDIMPTLLDLLGQPAPATQGRSLLPLMHGAELPEEPAYVESGRDDPLRHWHGLRNERWKYAAKPGNGGSRPALFDLAADPQETHNVIDSHPETAGQLRTQLEQLLQTNPLAGAPTGREMSALEKQQLQEQLKALGYI